MERTTSQINKLVAKLNNGNPVNIKLIKMAKPMTIDYDPITRCIWIDPDTLNLPENALKAKLLRALGYAHHTKSIKYARTAFLLGFGAFICVALMLLSHPVIAVVLGALQGISAFILLKIASENHEDVADAWARSKMVDYDEWVNG